MLPEDIHIPKKSTAESGKYFLTCGHKGKNHYEYFYSKNLWFLRDELCWVFSNSFTTGVGLGDFA
jgi:hypothetical protein